MTDQEKRNLVQKAVINKAVQLYRQGKTMQHEKLVDFINQQYPNLFEHPYVHMGKVLQSAYTICKT